MVIAGSSEVEHLDIESLQPTIRAAAQQALHDWGRPLTDLEDLVQEASLWYLSRPSVRAWISKAETETGRRRVFYRTKKVVLEDGSVEWKRQGGMSQILSGNQEEDNVFHGDELYSADAVKDWLLGRSTNKYLGGLIQTGLDSLDNQNPEHGSAIRARYEDERSTIPEAGGPGDGALSRRQIADL